MSKFAKRKINLMFVCGGGTGGHVDAMRAIASQINRDSPSIEIVFVGSKRGLKSVKDYKCHFLCVRALRQGSIAYKICSLFILLVGLLQAIVLYIKRPPDAVIGVGGYASAPMILIASIFRTPTYIVEQNIIPGLTNQILSFLANEMFVAYEGTKPLNRRINPKIAGHVVHKTHIEAAKAKKGNGCSERTTILCLGGSQGAKYINKIILETLPLLYVYRDRIQFVHQVGQNEDISVVDNSYKERGFFANIYGYINDIDKKYKAADFAICRAGAGTLAELLAYSIPAIVVPYPHSADDHQLRQAQYLESKGALICLDQRNLTPQLLSANVECLITNPNTLSMMKNSIKKLHNVNGAEFISSSILKAHGSY
ncbi:MAG: UDP-N-acetylglucosamine--N-acetylmuramyl-(pentapeptide) pyrophosphoryl-undecaprenol N-acetylglucosamine transferase [Parcubacteria group bacterium]